MCCSAQQKPLSDDIRGSILGMVRVQKKQTHQKLIIVLFQIAKIKKRLNALRQSWSPNNIQKHMNLYLLMGANEKVSNFSHMR